VFHWLRRPKARAAPRPPRRAERRATPRLTLDGTPLDPTVLSPRGQVQNISRGGLRLQGIDASATHFEGVVCVDGTDVAVQAEIVCRGDLWIGLRLTSTRPDWMEVTDAFLSPLELGARLREVDPELVRQDDPDAQIRWFYGGPTCELHLWCTGAVMQAAQLYLGDRVVHWRKDRGLSTGHVEGTGAGRVGYAASALVRNDVAADESTLLFARRLLRHAPIPPEVVALFA
jgi:hypothetical protein